MLVFMKDVSDILTPYLKKKDFIDFEKSNKRLLELKEKIQEWTKLNPPKGMEQMFPNLQRLDDEVKEMFQEYINICSTHYDEKSQTK